MNNRRVGRGRRASTRSRTLYRSGRTMHTGRSRARPDATSQAAAVPWAPSDATGRTSARSFPSSSSAPVHARIVCCTAAQSLAKRAVRARGSRRCLRLAGEAGTDGFGWLAREHRCCCSRIRALCSVRQMCRACRAEQSRSLARQSAQARSRKHPDCAHCTGSHAGSRQRAAGSRVRFGQSVELSTTINGNVRKTLDATPRPRALPLAHLLPGPPGAGRRHDGSIPIHAPLPAASCRQQRNLSCILHGVLFGIPRRSAIPECIGANCRQG